MQKLFIAIPVPASIVEAAEKLQQQNQHLKSVRWVSSENLHITVYFLGVVEASLTDKIKVQMESCLIKCSPFTLQFEKFSPEGGKNNKPSMLWARFQRNPLFSGLVSELASSLVPEGAAALKFLNPVPHITLARIKSGAAPEIDLNFTCEIPFDGYELWESIRLKNGVKYERKFRIAF